MRKRMLTLLVCLALLLAAAPVKTAAAEVPYQTYTYDKWGVATPAPTDISPPGALAGPSWAAEISAVQWTCTTAGSRDAFMCPIREIPGS